MAGGPPLKQSWLGSDRVVPRRLARPLRVFLNNEASGGVVLLIATLVALIWANSPLAESYESLWHTKIEISVGTFTLDEDLQHWVNDGLMAIFFFVVGLEIKRELVVGELNSLRRAILPAVAALGGMLVPALIYVALNWGGQTEGWGVPMATDIAFAVGVLALLGRRAPATLKVFVLSLAIVDDIGAIAAIALFYSSGIDPEWLLAAGFLIVLIVVLRRLRVLWVPIYAVVGIAVWLATFESGVHATIAGVALGLLTPALPTDPGGYGDVAGRASRLPDEPDAESVRQVGLQAKEVVSAAERFEHLLHPWTSHVVIPIFALANAGVELTSEGIRDAFGSRVTIGIALGLIVGKLVGITGFSWVAVRLRFGELPNEMTWRHLAGGAAVAGIGFTVSLFISSLAFEDEGTLSSAKIGILMGSVIAAAIGAIVLARVSKGHERDG